MDNCNYAGAFSIVSGLSDIKIDFKTSEPILDANNIIVGSEEIAFQRVTMTIPLAKDFLEKLSKAISDYESKFGSVQSTTDLSKKIAEMR